jgi:hypothetical protein
MSRLKTLPPKNIPAPPSFPPLECKLEGQGTITVGQKLDLACPTVGTMITSQSTIKFENGDTSQPFTMEFLGTPEIKGDSLHQTVTSYKVGSHDFSQLYLTIDNKKYHLNSQRLNVQTVIQNSNQSQGSNQQGAQSAPTPYPIFDPERVPAPWWWWAVWMGLLALILGFFIWQTVRWLKERKREKSLVPERELTPQEKFQRRIRKLESTGFHQKGEFKAFALELTNILKTAIGAQLRFPAEDMTSEELLTILERRHRVFFQTSGQSLQTFFSELDQIKFAKIETTAARCMSLLDSSIKIGQDLFGGIS